ncbi:MULTISPECIES: phycobilisome degradation protein NblB [Spirulina sp. CCY15215]|uniref:phycobilisome degradation protein NblB n=1 Tax=Spirulina sp. CCY15215 TaxID=2767591 RepID=UPI0019507177|nr:HEAT repeat domain-containing protein [Spirulina major]
MTPESVQTLLQSEDYGDRIKGLNQLRQMPQDLAFEMIQPLIVDANVRVRYAAVSQMDRLGEVNRDKSLEILRDRLSNDKETDVQAAAADAIAALKLTEGFEDLRTAYQQSSEWLLQFSIIAALGEMGDPRGFELLEDALASDNGLLQSTAVGAFGELGDRRAVPLLLPFLDHPDWQLRHRLAQALTHLGGEEAKTALEYLAKDEVEQVAIEAKRNLNPE